MTHVVLAFRPLASPRRIAELESVPGVTAEAAPYDMPHEVRTALEADPNDHAALAAAPPLTAEQRAAFRRAEAILALDAPPGLGADVPNLRLVQTVASGVGNWRSCRLDLERVAVCNAAGVTAPAISEWVVGQVLRVLKRTDEIAANQVEHRWQQTFGETLAGKRMAIVGLGEIGSALANRAAAFDVEVHGVRRTPGSPPPGVVALHHPDELLDLLMSCDVVVGCLPGTAGTEDVFDAAAFAAMPEGAIFVNVGRGGSVDESALVAALRSGHLRAACLDVTREEPVPPDSELWDCPRLFLSPHSAVVPGALLDGVWRRLIANIQALETGGPLQHQIRLDAP